MRNELLDPVADTLSDLTFQAAALAGVIGAWWRSLRRARRYSRYASRHKAKWIPLGPQLRMEDGSWTYLKGYAAA